MKDEIRRRELADFLRTRRARLTPESAGLIRGQRRRTPGLRREEVAELAGLGLAWYTWLEQGRDINVSDDVLGAIARALRLNDDERDHLFSLARRLPVVPADGASIGEVSARELAVLDALDPNPAYIRDSCWNLLALNGAFAKATRFDEVPLEERNLLWLLFTDGNARRLSEDWEETAQFAVAQFRFEAARNLDQPQAIELIERLRGVSADFRELWSYHDVYSGVGSLTTWKHDAAGHLQFERCTLSLGRSTSPAYLGSLQRLNVLVPVPGTDTSDHLHLLNNSAA